MITVCLASLEYSAAWYPAAECFSEAWYRKDYDTVSTLLEARERSIVNDLHNQPTPTPHSTVFST